eukprot:8657394-Alexandrium_andersonii.AAC.1
MVRLDPSKDRCPWCLEGQETITHLWWECQRFSEVRDQCQVCSALDVSALPGLLRDMAVAPAMVLKKGATLWGSEKEVGFPVWEDLEDDLESQLRQLCADAGLDLQSGVPVGRLYEAIQGPVRTPELPSMRAVEGQPPEAPNAYMDGSVSEPSRPERALGGVGVWAPQASEDVVLPAFHDFYQPTAYSGGFG